MFALKTLLAAVYVSAVLAASVEKQPVAEIISEASSVNENGYNFEFKTSDGVSRKEEAQLITIGDLQGISVKGSYSYTAPDGVTYEVTFTADDKGYKPQLRIVNGDKQ